MLRKMLLVLLLITLVAAGGAVSAQDATPIRIGLLVDQSGGLTIYGFEMEFGFKLGLLYQTGIDPSDYASIDDALADVRIAGRPVEILVRDNASEVDTGVSQARELIEQQGVEILVGAPSSGVTVGLQQVAQDFGVILMATPGASAAITSTNFNENTFRVCRNGAQDFLTFGSVAADQFGTDFVMLAADYEFGRSLAQAAEVSLPNYGVNFVQSTIYAPLETTDFTQYVQQVLAAEADVLLPIWAGDGTVTLFQQLAEFGVLEEMEVATGMNSNDIVAVSDPSTIGQLGWIVYHYAFPETEINDWLTEHYREIYDDVPDLFSECSFATAQALAIALEATEGDTFPDTMIPALEGLIFEGPKGNYYIRPSDHQALAPMYVVRVDNLDDPESRFFELVGVAGALDIAPPCILPEGLEDRCEMDAEFLETVRELETAE
ncbi:MAG: ABC transporter substrate-binding protein [Chloroflexi bacterium]|nr:ABC transporter substrate-binding protein [Chloroflexota bacterium]